MVIQAGMPIFITVEERNFERLLGASLNAGSCHKRQRRKRQSVPAKREKSQTPKVLTAILTLPNLTQPNLTSLNLT